MRSRIQAVVLPAEGGELGDEVRRVFLELHRAADPNVLTGECAPATDVYESDEALHIAVDLPGVPPETIRLVAVRDTLLIAGEKRPSRAHHGDATFHLVERGFGRFARTVRLGRTCDTTRATATLADGELCVVVPKVEDRRGRRIEIPVGVARDVRSS